MAKIKEVFVRSPYNYDRDAASDDSGLKCLDESRAQQSFAEECDINVIVRRFGLTGQLPPDMRFPTSGDFTGVNDFQTAMNAVVAARQEFDKMPAHVRARFHNDPAELIAFLDDADNRSEAVKLGLIPKAATPEEVEAARAAGPLTVGALEKALQVLAPQVGAKPA